MDKTTVHIHRLFEKSGYCGAFGIFAKSGLYGKRPCAFQLHTGMFCLD